MGEDIQVRISSYHLRRRAQPKNEYNRLAARKRLCQPENALQGLLILRRVLTHLHLGIPRLDTARKDLLLQTISALPNQLQLPFPPYRSRST
jgi:hypothetical protein